MCAVTITISIVHLAIINSNLIIYWHIMQKLSYVIIIDIYILTSQLSLDE